MTAPSLEVKNLCHIYRGRKQELIALNDLSFSLRGKNLVALLGPNGSGKSTFFKLLSMQLSRQKGIIKLNDQDVLQARDWRQSLGYTFQHPALDPCLTVMENIEVHAALYGMTRQQSLKKCEELLKQFALWDRKESFVKELSGGLARRVELIKSLIHDPKVLVLDEPTNGLDPNMRHEFWNFLRMHCEKRLVIVATHLMEEAELCDEIILFHKGQVVEQGSPEAVCNRADYDVLRLSFKCSKDRNLFCENVSQSKISWAEIGERQLIVRCKNTQEWMSLVQSERWITKFSALQWGPADLSEVFLSLTGAKLESVKGGEVIN